MRVSCGIVAAAMLAALSQPAAAVCVYRGLATMCYDDNAPKYEKSGGGSKALMVEYADPPAAVPGDLKAIVMQPVASSDDNAWVMTPGSSAGAATARSIDVSAPACEPGLSCD
ncbi:hypothetical protein [Dongia sp.]|uniref:hypothetical protein n=1 Tax=Dongia sp. TaxID=1977262 RepID=UPI0037539EEA